MKLERCILHRVMPAVVLLLAASFGHAQEGITFNVPFNFTIGTQSLPAGEYSVRPLPQSLNKMLLRNQSGQVLVLVQTTPMESRRTPDSPIVVFNRYGGQYFLNQIWERSDEFGQKVAKSRSEVELAKATHTTPQLVALTSAAR